MDQEGLTRKDLEPYIGPCGRVSEIFSGKRERSLNMIRKPHKGLHNSALYISLESLVN